MAEHTKIEWADHTRRGVNPLTGMPGPTPKPPADGNKLQARQRINVEVRTGRRPHPYLVDLSRLRLTYSALG